MTTTTISGEIIRIRRFDDGYTVLSVNADERGAKHLIGQNLTLVGTMPEFAEGMLIDAVTSEVQHPKYGRQYKVQEIQASGFNEKKSLVRFLSSSFTGIGMSIATKIVDKLGMDALTVLDENPTVVSSVPGMTGAKVDKFVQEWQEKRASHQVFSKLMAYGMTMGMATKVYKQFGDRTIETVEENPYSIIVIPGIGFHKADTIALKMGVAIDSPRRIKAAIQFVFDNVMWSMGHCYLTRNQVLAETGKLLENQLTANQIALALDELVKDLVAVIDDDRVYLSHIYAAEQIVADHMSSMLNYPSEPFYNDLDALRWDLGHYGLTNEIELAPEQEEAIFTALNSRICIITGGPGTGKTTITRTICQLLKAKGIYYNLCAPTGRASKRLAEATGDEAKTIHRTLGYVNGFFEHDSTNPLDADCILVDEVSMIDILLFRSLLDALQPHCRLIMVGDADQLPSVGPGNVLHDSIASGAIPVVCLHKVFRQSKGSTIIDVAHEILEGRTPDLQSPAKSAGKNCMLVASVDIDVLVGHIVSLVQTHIPKVGFMPSDIQVLTPMRERGLGINDLNPQLQAVINPPSPEKPEIHAENRLLRLGDRVMHIRNDYKKEVFNGDIGFIADIQKCEDATVIFVRYPDKDDLVTYERSEWTDIQLAYCCTIHKSQGSEYPVVVLVLHPSQYIMLQRNLLYTGLTRAQKLCIIAGTFDAVDTAVHNNKIQRRNTTLAERIMCLAKN